jgi:Uma2 family endonuclease
VILTPYDVVQPDLVLVTDVGQISSRGIEGPPTLLVEVAAPSTVAYDRSTRSHLYAALAVPHLWFLDPEGRTLQCFRLDGQAWRLVLEGASGDTVEHPDWSGLVIRLADLWM